MWQPIIVVIGLLISLLSSECRAQVSNFRGTGTELLNACRDAEAQRDGATSGFAQGFCFGAVTAAADMLEGSEFCITAGLQNVQLVRIAIRYIEANPEKQHLRLSVLAALAFKQAFPCPKRAGR